MRKTLNLVLALGLAASAFANVAAAQQAAACPNPDDLTVVDLTKATNVHEQDVLFVGGPLGFGVYTGPDFVVDLATPSDDVLITLTWSDGFSDYDLTIDDADGNEMATAEASDSASESVVVKLSDCMRFEVGIYNFLGAPVNDDMVLTIELD